MPEGSVWKSERLIINSLGDTVGVPETSDTRYKVTAGESPGESEPWRVYTGSGTQLYDFEGALIGHLDLEGNVVFEVEAWVPVAKRPFTFLRCFVQ